MADLKGLFALPPGVDFAQQTAAGLIARMAARPPEDMGRVTLYANSGRTLTALGAAFARGGAMLLPRMRLIADLGAGDAGLAPPLARRLDLARLVDAALGSDSGQSVPALTQSLAELMAEMQAEGLGPDALDRIDAADHAAHWQRALAFLRIAAGFHLTGPAVDPEARQRATAERLAADWAAGRNLPDGPVIVAGSTGSHGATRLFMQAVAGLPQGAVILPGFDADTPPDVWDRLVGGDEDHPQARFAPLIAALGLPRPWTDAPAPDPARNRLVSLALRPAPVTDSWVADGPALGDLAPLARNMTLIEADQPADEAAAIAALIREAVERGQPVTLIAADRTLTRRVTAALDRWRIVPDDSAGVPLPLTAAGLFLRHIAALWGQPLAMDALLVLLKHPLAATGAGEGARRQHLLITRELELRLRRHGPVFPDGTALRDWADEDRAKADARRPWADWAAQALDETRARIASGPGPRPLAERLADLRHLAERWAAGPGGDAGASQLYAEKPGEKARAVLDHLAAHADAGPPLTAAEFAQLLHEQLQAQAVRADAAAHPLVRIRGPREARTEAVGLVILGGLNEGGWPQALAPDPWLSRPMRRQAGLTLPERRIGLAAHDIQIGLAAEQVVLTRARRSDEAETIPSRWLNRLVNLMSGLPGQSGPQALDAMRARGNRWTALAAAIAEPAAAIPRAPRPAPVPPAPALDRLSVTGIRTLIRDPYAVYASRVLRLSPLDPLRPEPDPASRGTVLHAVIQRFLTPPPTALDSVADLRDRLMAAADEVLAAEVPWPSTRLFWRARLAGIADRLASEERERLQTGAPMIVEKHREWPLPGLPFTLTAKPDRIDRQDDGTAVVYDYKSGAPPSQAKVRRFDKQLPLEALMVEAGAFGTPLPVAALRYIQLGGEGKTAPIDWNDAVRAETRDGLALLLAGYLDGTHGFTARLAMEKDSDASDYDHLSRLGEWSATDAAQRIKVGR
ncbi:double-strand break repair protein AddB [Paracoccus luteus]|uniref:double-strand break repair protein AddB n=1 Tax=Paracoccus luteus TaxID=2508543 RepID=UPI00106FEE77|nr:double-strand break repair protein AddB [Paracoccus luteus]